MFGLPDPFPPVAGCGVVGSTLPGGHDADPDGRLVRSVEDCLTSARALARSRRRILPVAGLGFLDCSTGEIKPPFCDTGVENTVEPIVSDAPQKGPNDALIDYLSCVLRGDNALERAKFHFGAGLSWEGSKRGGYGYECSARRGGVALYWGGDKCGDTVFVQCSGSGCRELEAAGLIGGTGMLDGLSQWQAFLAELIADDVTIKRVDFAIDDTEGALNLDIIAEYWRNDDVATRIQKFNRVQGVSKGAGVSSDTIYLGSRESMMFVRIYNKKLEQINRGNPCTLDHWVRFELEVKDSKAHIVAGVFVETGFACVAPIILGLIDFKDPNDRDQNDTRRRSAGWWSSWVSSVSRLRVQVAPKVVTIASKAAWLKNQCAKALHVVAHSPGYGRGYLEKIIKEGGERLSMADMKIFFPVYPSGGSKTCSILPLSA